ncbi:MAG: M23 family metallopeptidase [Chloroflexi bacterium]|nr:M23 family metallopeptidase [Chloroflexota bacterium]
MRFEIKELDNHKDRIGYFLGCAIVFILALSSCTPRTAPSIDFDEAISVPTTVLQQAEIQIPAQPTSTPAPSVMPTSQPTVHQDLYTSAPVPTERPAVQLFPDAELVYSPTSKDFNTAHYLQEMGGFLSSYRQYLMITGWTSAADIIDRIAWENSINPRLLLALLEFQSQCVLGQPSDLENFESALGATNYYRKDLYGQLTWAVRVLSDGYYGWITGKLTQISFTDGTIFRPPPNSNAGTVALYYFFAQLGDRSLWEQALDPHQGFLTQYEDMFPGTWSRAEMVEPLLPDDLIQPALTLPFEIGEIWSYTGGPHPAFEGNGPRASLDFAPSMNESGCVSSDEWVVAMADGLVTRSDLGVVIQDLDGDGYEQTGWVLMYVHLADQDRVLAGTYLQAGQRIGHPSCAGGRATGTHIHIVRKYNGVWIATDNAIPFVLDGWTAHDGAESYQGTLIRGDEKVTAHQFGSQISIITRDE